MKRAKKILAFVILFAMMICFSSVSSLCDTRINQELIENGSFTEMIVNFETDYIQSQNFLVYEGLYAFVKSAKEIYDSLAPCTDHTTGDGYYLVFNSSPKPDKRVWAKKFTNLYKGGIYEFSFWYVGVHHRKPAVLSVTINGVPQFPYSIYLDSNVCVWKQAVFRWLAEDTDTAEIIIYNKNLAPDGNDFGIDDLSFQLKCTIKADAGEDLQICEGESIKLNAKVSGGLLPYTYYWYPPDGLSSNIELQPICNTKVSRTYYLNIVDGNNCLAQDSVRVNVIRKPDTKITADKPTTLCNNDSITLSAEENYHYLWSTGDTTRSIKVKKSGTYKLVIWNNFGCIDSNEIKIVFLPLPDAKITTDKPTEICPCDIITLTASGGVNYIWSNGKIEPSIVVSDSGRYSVTVIDRNGCRSTVDTVVTIKSVEAKVSFDDVYANVGEKVKFDLKIRYLKNLYECNFQDFSARIKFNKTMLFPINNTPLGYSDEFFHYIDINSHSADSLLGSLEFFSTLGNDVCTDIIIENFSWGCDGIKVIPENSKFCQLNICNKPVPRLFEETNRLSISQSYPNPASEFAEVMITLIEDAPSRFYLMNNIGQIVQGYELIIEKSGTYKYILDCTKLSPGIYYYILETPTGTLSKALSIVK